MNNGITINLPSITWPLVFLVFGFILAYRSGYFKSTSKPKRKGKQTRKTRKVKPPAASNSQYTLTKTGNEKVFRPNNNSDF